MEDKSSRQSSSDNQDDLSASSVSKDQSKVLICCSNDQIDPLIIMPYSTYSLINKYSSFIYFILLHLYLLLFIHTYTYILY
jgi:hypothetical protein